MLPTALHLIEEVRAARERAGSLLLGLDFDGTLAPIVPRPEDAALPPGTRPLLQALAARDDTTVALVSGRGLADVARRVGLPDLYYAGNHGLEIQGPGMQRVHPEARDAREQLAGVVHNLEAELGRVEGVIIEDKGLTVSVHYRLAGDEAEAGRVRDLAHRCCRGVPGIRASDGRKVVEIRPDVDWHKGRALRFLRESLGPGAPVLFVGDDRTDEDAFREVGDDGWSIIVAGRPPADTRARAALASTAEVADFLRALL